MTDQWERDTLSALNEKRRMCGEQLFIEHDFLYQNAKEYATNMIIPWESINREDWMPCEIAIGAIKPDGKGTVTTWTFEDGNYNYKGQGADGAQGSGWLYYWRQRKIPLYSTNYFWAKPQQPKGITGGNMVASCTCAHWTPPSKIADMLWSKELQEYHGDYAAIAIANDDTRTYVALAVSEWL